MEFREKNHSGEVNRRRMEDEHQLPVPTAYTSYTHWRIQGSAQTPHYPSMSKSHSAHRVPLHVRTSLLIHSSHLCTRQVTECLVGSQLSL